MKPLTKKIALFLILTTGLMWATVSQAQSYQAKVDTLA